MTVPPPAIDFVALEVILPLRKRVIIAGTGRVTPYFPGDDDDNTRHAGLVEGGDCVACATALVSEWEGRPAWQIRGMAVAPEHQKQGLGNLLLKFLERELPAVRTAGGLWCNARESAVPFYLQAGFQVMSDRFYIEGIGPHYRLFKPLM